MATYIRFSYRVAYILQVRPKLPQAIGNVEYIAYGMPSLSVYLPLSGCVNINPEMIKEPTGEQRLLPTDIPHAANAGYAGLPMRLRQMQHARKHFEQQTAKVVI